MIRIGRGKSLRMRAMTIAEVMVASSISFIISTATVGIIGYVQKATAKSYYYNRSSQEARILSDIIARDIRGAIQLEATYNDGKTVHKAADNVLILRVPSIDANGDILDTANLNNKVDRIIYEPDPQKPTRLLRRVFPGNGSSRLAETRSLGEAFGSASFADTFASQPNAQGADVVYYQFIVSRKWSGKTYQTPIAGSVELRNKPYAGS